LPWLLARRKKKLRPPRLLRLLRPLLRLRLLRLLTPPLLRPLRLLLTLLLRPLRLPLRLLRLLLTLLLLPLLRLLRSNQLRAIETGLRAGFFSSLFFKMTETVALAIKKPATKAGFLSKLMIISARPPAASGSWRRSASFPACRRWSGR
jgi:hypothetical protein